MGNELDSLGDALTIEEKKFSDVSAEKRKLQRNEWFGVLLRIRNNAIIVLAIICLQLPFELAYAHLYEITETEVMRSVFPMICLLVGLAQNCATDLLGSFPFLVLYICFSQYFDISGCHSNLHCALYYSDRCYTMQIFVDCYISCCDSVLHQNWWQGICQFDKV